MDKKPPLTQTARTLVGSDRNELGVFLKQEVVDESNNGGGSATTRKKTRRYQCTTGFQAGGDGGTEKQDDRMGESRDARKQSLVWGKAATGRLRRDRRSGGGDGVIRPLQQVTCSP